MRFFCSTLRAWLLFGDVDETYRFDSIVTPTRSAEDDDGGAEFIVVRTMPFASSNEVQTRTVSAHRNPHSASEV